MDWKKLLSKEAYFERKREPDVFNKYPSSVFEKDYEQIITSSAFRRLQDKTQVFPLDKSDFVRTRLTHSIEVSTIARQLGIMIINNKEVTKKKDFQKYAKEVVNIPSILSCAGLLHDIGNPPFGHYGEVVIGKWFEDALDNDKFEFDGKLICSILNKQMKNDLINFEGNAQALRLLTKSRNNGYHTNLSYAVLNSLIKYPTNSKEYSKEDLDIKKHKFGYFYSENEIFNEICSNTGTLIEEKVCRHPLVFIMEIADDIAYSTADLVDAFKKGLFTLDEFVKFYSESANKIQGKYRKEYTNRLLEELKEMIDNCEERNVENDFNIFQEWIVVVKKWLMYAAAYGFSKAYDEILAGKYTHDILFDTNHRETIKILKDAMKKFVFDNVEILKLELSAKKIIEELLNDFIYAVIYWEEGEKEENMSKSDWKYIKIIPQGLRDEYIKSKPTDEAERLYYKFLMVTDFISGMTDSYAKNLYQELYGMV